MKQQVTMALATTLMAAGAMAESGITFNLTPSTTLNISGVADIYMAAVDTGPKTVSLMGSSGLSQSNITFRIEKTIPNRDLTVGTTLGIGYGPDTGRGSSGSLGASNVVFGRQATVDIRGKLGSVSLGRQGSLFFSSVASYDGLAWGSGIGPFLYNGPNVNTTSNAIRYSSPEWKGWTVGSLYSLGEQAGVSSDSRANSQWMGGLGYKQGAFRSTLSYWRMYLTTSPVTASGTVSTANTEVAGVVNMLSWGATYDVGRFKPWVIVATARDSTPNGAAVLNYGSNTVSNTGYTANQRAYELGLRTRLSDDLALFVITGGMKDRDHDGVGGRMSSVRLNYSYDKDVTFWTGAGVLNNDKNSYFQILDASANSPVSASTAGTIYGGSGYTTNSAYAGKTVRSVAAGVRYTF